MAFNWKALIEMARALSLQAPNSPDKEAWHRSALSRVYFGAYGYARGFAVRYLGFIAQQAAEDHGRLKAHLRGKRRRGDADRLDLLRQWRNVADYADDLPAGIDPASSVGEAIKLAEVIFLSLAPPKKE